MYHPMYTSWLNPQPTRQRRPSAPKPTPRREQKARTYRQQHGFGYVQSQLGALSKRPPKGDYDWRDDNSYPFPSSIVHYVATTALQRLAERAAAKAVTV
jgi:hypothetical protein